MRTLIWLVFLVAVPATAQSSGSFKIDEHVFNSGGQPTGGEVASSSNFRITLGSLGDGLPATAIGSASFAVELSFVAAYLPPGEVTGLLFDDKTTLRWEPEPSRDSYTLYRDGACLQPDLASESTTDTDTVPVDAVFAYLVTATNSLDEEGPRGFASDGTPRSASSCP